MKYLPSQRLEAEEMHWGSFYEILNQAWLFTLIIPAIIGLMQKDYLEFEASLHCTKRPCHKTKQKEFDQTTIQAHIIHSSQLWALPAVAFRLGALISVELNECKKYRFKTVIEFLAQLYFEDSIAVKQGSWCCSFRPKSSILSSPAFGGISGIVRLGW